MQNLLSYIQQVGNVLCALDLIYGFEKKTE